MKVLSYIGIAILVLIGILIGPALAMAFGACAFLGFIIIGGLDAIGIIKIPSDVGFNTLAGISFVIGAIIFIIYYSIAGLPEM